MTEIKRISVLWKPFDPLLYANMKTGALLAGLGVDTGRLLPLAALQKLLKGAVRFIDPALGVAAIDKISDLVVVVGTTPAQAQAQGVDATFITALKTPVMAVDLAVEALDASAIAWFRAFGDRLNIRVNSEVDQAALRTAGVSGVACGASLSQFINPAPDLGVRIAANWARHKLPEAICVVAGHKNRTRPAERALLALAFDGPVQGGYIVQHGLGALQMARGEFAPVSKADFAALKRRFNPDMPDAAFRRFCRNHLRAYFNTGAWMDSLRRYDLVAGGSFQGVALALQTQRMGLMVVEDSATESACASAGLPYIRAHDFAPGAGREYLKSIINFTPARYQAIRQKAAEGLYGFMRENSVELSPPFMRLLGDAPRAKTDGKNANG